LARSRPPSRFPPPPPRRAPGPRATARPRPRLSYVYLGNVGGPRGRDTFCPQCGELLIRREGFHARIIGLEGNNCRNCGKTIRLVGPEK
ncbi:MAG: AmmeMemoRadiSam system radical SAM enzyme, partial [Bacillota bacterium]